MQSRCVNYKNILVKCGFTGGGGIRGIYPSLPLSSSKVSQKRIKKRNLNSKIKRKKKKGKRKYKKIFFCIIPPQKELLNPRLLVREECGNDEFHQCSILWQLAKCQQYLWAPARRSEKSCMIFLMLLAVPTKWIMMHYLCFYYLMNNFGVWQI